VGQVGAASIPAQSGNSGELAGKYRLIAELGQGGMARVFLAVAQGADVKFRKLAVVKMLRPEIAIEPEFNEMFLEEARLCARLNHPNIVQTYDVGVDNGRHLIAMEFLQGVSMHAAVAKLGRAGGQFTALHQMTVLLKVLEGLRYAHDLKDYDGKSLEIVHRDVSPHNIFLTYDGQVKLLDFGIAKAATSNVHTATGVIKGKLTYMAPEQALGVPVDVRADLYPVGVMLWQAIAGRRRWPAGLNEAAILTRLGSGDPPESPDAVGHGLPAELDELVCKSLMPDRDARFKDAGEFIDALEGILRTLPAVSPRALGTMLSDAFADDRQRLQDVIEQQFRLLQTGRTPEPHLLPTLPPPRFSGSNLSGSSGPTGVSGDSDSGHHAPDEMDLAIPIDSGTQALQLGQSGSTLASAGMSATTKLKQQRSYTLAGILGGALIVVAGIAALLRAGQAHTGSGNIAPEMASGTAATLGSSVSPISPSAAPAAASQMVNVVAPNTAVDTASAAHVPADSRVHGGPAHGGGHASTATTAQATAAAATTAAVAADPPHPAPSATASPGGIDLTQHQAETKKVHLDTDNPWQR
jgi:serine/threonine-protein kinase